MKDDAGPKLNGPKAAEHRRSVIAKVILTVLVTAIAFAVAIPNCVVPATDSSPQYFRWSALVGAVLISGSGIYCIWFWK